MSDGPYRVGNHSPLNVWHDPDHEYATSSQVCMATEPSWAQEIVAALNAAKERDLLLWLHAEALYHRDVAHQMLERMETQHVTFGVLGTAEEIHPDWCRECRVDKLRAELDGVKTELARLEFGLGQLTGELLTNVDQDPTVQRRDVAQKIRDLIYGQQPDTEASEQGAECKETPSTFDWPPSNERLLASPSTPTEPADTAGVTDEVLADLLSLVGVTVTPEHVTTWTVSQRDEAADWAAAVHLSASDNDVEVPAKPSFLNSEMP